MKQITEFSVHDLNFTSYDRSHKERYGKNLHHLTYNGRHDFVYDEDFAGMAVEIEFCNDGCFDDPARGVRRKVEFTLIDQHERIPVYSVTRNIRIPATECILEYYLDLSASEIAFHPEHAYRLVMRDLTMESMLGDYAFRLYGQEKYGRPANWYSVECGGICTPGWNMLQKSMRLEEYEKYLVRFIVNQKMGSRRPAIMPELEVQLYCTATGEKTTACVEPQHKEKFSNQYYVDLTFEPDSRDYGVY